MMGDKLTESKLAASFAEWEWPPGKKEQMEFHEGWSVLVLNQKVNTKMLM